MNATDHSQTTARADVPETAGYQRTEPPIGTVPILRGASVVFRFRSTTSPPMFSSSSFSLKWESDRVPNFLPIGAVALIVLIVCTRIVVREIADR